MCGYRPTNESQGGTQGEILHASQGRLSESSSCRSDGFWDSQMGRLSHMSGDQQQLKGRHQARVITEQMVLVMARQGGWTAMGRWAKTLSSKLNIKGDYQAQVKSIQVRSFSWCQAGRLDGINGGQIHSSESWKTTLGSQETFLKTGTVTA
jgi:hypothetical protein